MHNTLAASDYGLLDGTTLTRRPNYWGALLWRRLMGPTVLESGVPIERGLHVYAHCQRGVPGSATLLLLNTNRTTSRSMTLASASQRYPLDATSLRSTFVRLNGTTLALDERNELPPIEDLPTAAGTLTFPPATISFLTIAAGNDACEGRCVPATGSRTVPGCQSSSTPASARAASAEMAARGAPSPASRHRAPDDPMTPQAGYPAPVRFGQA
jgi:hypothetical protein